MARREFTRDVRAAIVKRAMKGGEITCEGCGLILAGKVWHIDHIKADGMEIDKSRKLTAADGRLLGVACCHAPKTKRDVGTIAKAKRREAKDLGISRPRGSIPQRPRPERAAGKPTPPRRPLFVKWDRVSEDRGD